MVKKKGFVGKCLISLKWHSRKPIFACEVGALMTIDLQISDSMVLANDSRVSGDKRIEWLIC